MARYECRVGRIDADITTFRVLARMSWVATKLYNTALWSARETWSDTGKIPSGFDLQKVVLASPYHALLPAHTYQYPAHQVGNAFRSWYALRKVDKTANPPGFRRKEELSSTMFTEGAFRMVNGTILLTISKGLKDEFGYTGRFLPLRNIRWSTPLPDHGQIKQLEIVPEIGYFNVHAKILLPEPEWRTEGQVVAVDLGMRNPMVTIDEAGNTDIFKGGKILADLRYWNKEKGRVQMEVMGRSKGHKKHSKSLGRMTKHCSAQVKHAIHVMTSAFVEICDQRNVREVVVGDLNGIKKNKKGKGKGWSDKSSQSWQQFPVRKVVAQLGYKLARYGIRLVEQDERGTSIGRCSACGCTERGKLHRVHRGMFMCENCNTIQNADINGAGNQLARYLRREHSQSSSGVLAIPSVYRWNGHRWTVVV
ncbi:MAG: transposase [Methanomassiliicoccales archaeon]|jgi:putative transposase